MPLATGVQILTCIGRLDMLAHGFEFGGVGGGCGWSVLRDTAPFVANMSSGAHYIFYRLYFTSATLPITLCNSYAAYNSIQQLRCLLLLYYTYNSYAAYYYSIQQLCCSSRVSGLFLF